MGSRTGMVGQMVETVANPEHASMPARPRRSLRIVVAHDWLCGYRGGECVLDAIIRLVRRHHELAGFYVMFDDGRAVTPAIDATERAVSPVGRMPMASTRLRRWLLPLYPRAVRQLSEELERQHAGRKIDLLITSSSAAIKGLRAPYGVPHLCYCHSPPRYIWAQAREYERDSAVRRLGLRMWRRSYQRWDQLGTSADYVTRLLANSRYTAEQVTRCYERSARVVHPPVRTDYFTPAVERMGQSRDDYWLLVGALEPYKRVDLAINAAAKLGKHLVVVGSGSQRARLERLAHAHRGSRIELVGRVDDDRLREYYRSARLLLFPQVEDFGIVAVEAQACGLPVVARASGGALDTVRDGVTGALFNEPSVESLVAAAIRCPQRCDAACRVNAERFAEEVFFDAMLAEIESIAVPHAARA
ncbi:MAG TPA: glycosyltransferase [Phycisphaerales bacterium]|nr:glycosyltransferase [Phycisphaerales bacterium]